MVSEEIVILIIMQSVGLLLGLLSPVVTGCTAFFARIEKSSCCGSNLELSKTEKLQTELKQTISEHKIEMDNIIEMLKKK